jgi:arginine exporter protein ArgO
MDLHVAAIAASPALPALLAGVAAGLGVALPLGAIGVLLVQEGMSRGRRAALSAANGVATVDLAYAGVAVLAGGAVAQALIGREGLVRWAGAVVLAGLALRGLAKSRRPAAEFDRPPAAAAARSAFWRFVGLTALNPLTAVYFTVFVLHGLGRRPRRAGERHGPGCRLRPRRVRRVVGLAGRPGARRSAGRGAATSPRSNLDGHRGLQHRPGLCSSAGQQRVTRDPGSQGWSDEVRAGQSTGLAPGPRDGESVRCPDGRGAGGLGVPVPGGAGEAREHHERPAGPGDDNRPRLLLR